MAVNNNFEYDGLTGTSYYVSAFYGDDANAGTKLAPFLTKAKAELTASSGDNIILGSGIYVEQVSVSTNSYKYFGEGRVVIQEPGGPTANALYQDAERVENIIFLDWNGTAVIKHAAQAPANVRPVFINCQFIDSTIEAGIDSSFGYYMGCIFDTIDFDSNGDVDASTQAGGIFNCIFRECTGDLPPLVDYVDGVFNNHFVESDNLMIGIAIGQPTDKFDFNNIEDGLNGETDNAAIQGLGFNLNGSAFLSVNIFNDFDMLRPTSDYFIQDYTQKTTSPVLLTSKSKGPLCRFNEGVRFDAVFLEGSNIMIDNVTLVGSQLTLDALESEGFIQNDLDLGSIKKLNLINVLQEITFDVGDGRADNIADFLQDTGTDIKATYDIEIMHRKELADSFTVSVVEYDKYMLDRSPQVIEARFLRINLTLRDYTI